MEEHQEQQEGRQPQADPEQVAPADPVAHQPQRGAQPQERGLGAPAGDTELSHCRVPSLPAPPAPLGAHLGLGSVGCLLGSSRPFPTGRSSASCAVSSSRLSCSFPCGAQGGGWGTGSVPAAPQPRHPDVPNLQRAAGRCPPAWCRATSPEPSACGTGPEGSAPAPGSGTRPGTTRTGPAV